jgi:hypothetical protein
VAAEVLTAVTAGHVEVLTDVLSPLHVIPIGRIVVGAGKQTDARWTPDEPEVA